MSELAALAGEFDDAAANTHARVAGILRMYGQLGVTRTVSLLTRVQVPTKKSERTGRTVYVPIPHPYAGEAAYRRTGHYSTTFGPEELIDFGDGSLAVEWGTDDPRAPRHEYGPEGNQEKALPALFPAHEWAAERVELALERMMQEL